MGGNIETAREWYQEPLEILLQEHEASGQLARPESRVCRWEGGLESFHLGSNHRLDLNSISLPPATGRARREARHANWDHRSARIRLRSRDDRGAYEQAPWVSPSQHPRPFWGWRGCRKQSWLGPKEEGGTEPGSPPDLSVLARAALPPSDPRGEIWAFSATNLHQNLSSVQPPSQFWINSVRVGSSRASDPLHMGTSCDKEPGNPGVTACTRALGGTLNTPRPGVPSRDVGMGAVKVAKPKQMHTGHTTLEIPARRTKRSDSPTYPFGL
ncbi:uncharacterized protein An12g08430 [Aspergillus niger]|uniref:Contig An12c0280, genomic contig n=2 Tax=Aspergillus niger TaxID=5061 RepID=A2R0F5_ASPNC|nr:uncharacterized protein An12g08430 [Aspergillus niger]CAK41293.1 unnamed protein product [Aspergillus niger]